MGEDTFSNPLFEIIASPLRLSRVETVASLAFCRNLLHFPTLFANGLTNVHLFRAGAHLGACTSGVPAHQPKSLQECDGFLSGIGAAGGLTVEMTRVIWSWCVPGSGPGVLHGTVAPETTSAAPPDMHRHKRRGITTQQTRTAAAQGRLQPILIGDQQYHCYFSPYVSIYFPACNLMG